MTDKTTRIYLDLTDEQMDNTSGHLNTITRKLRDAIVAQRPRPITVGDRVRFSMADSPIFSVEAIVKDRLWLWHGGSPWGTRPVSDLTRVDDEKQS